MPSRVPVDVSVIQKLEELENDYNQGDLTSKGYCRKMWDLLKPYAKKTEIKEVEKLQCLLQVDIKEEQYFQKMIEVIQRVKESERKLLGSRGDNLYCEPEEDISTSDSIRNSGHHSENGNGTLEFCNGKEKENGSSKVEQSTKKSNESTANSKKETNESTADSKKETNERISNLSDSDSEEDKPLSTVLNKSRGRKLGTVKEISSLGAGPSNHKSPKISKKSLSASKGKRKSEPRSANCSNSLTSYFEKQEKKTQSPEVKSENDTKEEITSEMDTEGPPSPRSSVKRDIDESSEEDTKPPKKIKTESEAKKIKAETNSSGKSKKLMMTPKKCDICHQLLEDSDLKMYQGHPHNAVDEFVALTDPKLSLFTGEEDDVHDDDQRPTNKVTYFSIYDKEGHLCPIDSGLIERNVLLYFSGYLKPVYEEDPTPEGGIATKDMGPINEWWFSGFDGGEKALIGFSTAYGEYYLMEPSVDYSPLMDCLKQKIYMGKLVIEFLLEEINPSYEDLLNKIQTCVPPPGMSQLNEDSLLKHSQFICDQVVSFDAACPGDDNPLITSPCLRTLIHYAGITFGKRQVMRRGEKKQYKEKKPQWTKATTTPLVKNVFETFFTDQLDKSEHDLIHKRKRCGVCEACQLPDCGSCRNCLNMIKFGGTGTSKQACIKRKCPNMAVAEADDSEPEDEDLYQAAAEERGKSSFVTMRSRQIGSGKKEVKWIGKSTFDDGKRIFYNSAKVGDVEINVGDCVTVEPANLTAPVVIGKVSYMWQNTFNQKYMHASWFCRSSETVLGETGDPHELFIVDDCENTLLSGITGKVNVNYQPLASTWKTDGGLKVEQPSMDERNFFYRFRYSETTGRFEDVLPDPPCRNKSTQHRFCAPCERLYQLQKFETPFVDEKLEEKGPKSETMYGLVKWKGEEYRPGCCVFLQPTAFKFKTYGVVFTPENRKSDDIDEDKFPELYRKGSEYIKGSNDETPQPFCIGLITSIITNSEDKIVAPSDICLKVVKFYRPENTVGVTTQYHQLDLNMLYASEEEKIVNFRDVAGKCVVVYRENLVDDLTSWTKAGPNRFYFTEAYDSKAREIVEPSRQMKYLGDVGKGGGGKGKGKKSSSTVEKKKKMEIETWPSVSQPLRCLDVFAGCGGFSEGLHQAEIVDTKWAIEKEEAAANAFKLNNSSCTVFTDDCNDILKMVMNGDEKNSKGQKLPQKGDVEMLVGGPPCQGFSGMNRFNSRQYSLFKNSLIVSYLSYCDYYRPRFFILENVRNFVSFKNSMVLKLTLRCLIQMGYQVAFGVLQAGNYGVPQTRRRAIIMAAAPGEILPLYPEPTHVFSLRTSQLSIMVGDKKFQSNCQWIDSAPYRTITVGDAMSDLPEIINGANQDEIPYGGDPLTYFQKLMRGDQYQSMLKDHICKEMASIVKTRIAHIPIASGSDWRDLPNISVELSDGNFTKKLQYTHHDKKNGRSSSGALRGVCSCASGKTCDPMDRQYNTLIPWCLPHTGNRHNHWSGLYGRLEWAGFFSTTVTNPEPMGKQGRVLHPEQTRVVSVRECARSQGFPDKYRFYGNILAKHRQIGNAVPPPMGAAIGREIRRSIYLKEESKKEDYNN